MIYSPVAIDNNKCFEYQDTVILRVYDTININQVNNYTDYNTGNHYSSKKGSVLLTDSPVCINHEDLTTDFYYRNDISHILVVFLIICIFVFYIPYKIFLRFYRKGR